MARAPLKVAQLAVLPAALAVVSLTVSPRHVRPRSERTEPESSGSAQPAERFFAAGTPPAIEIDLERATAAVAGETSSTWFQVTVVAELRDDAAAETAARNLADLLAASARHFEESGSAGARSVLLDSVHAAPLTPPEASALERSGSRSEIGIGWPGSSTDAGATVGRLGRVLVVAGLKGDFAGLRRNPLPALLEAWGARTFVEGDPGGGVTPAIDLSCEAPDEASAERLASSLDRYLSLPLSMFLRPPWHPAGVTPEQERARATFVAITRAVQRALSDPRIFEALNEHLVRRTDPAEIGRLIARIRKEAALEALEGAIRGTDRDEVVVVELRRAVTGSPGWLHDPSLRRRLADRLGSLSVEVSSSRAPGEAAPVEPTAAERAHGATGRVRVEGRRVALAGLVFHRVARGLPALLRQLARAGCREVRLGVAREPSPTSLVPRPELDDPEGE